MLLLTVRPCFVTNLSTLQITHTRNKELQDPPYVNDTSSDIKVVIVVDIILSSIILLVNS